MKKILCFSLVAMLTMAILISSIPALAESQRVVNVSSAQELIDAIASDTKIIIRQGNYLVPAGSNEHGVPQGIMIENINNLTIQADGLVDIQLDTGECPVFEVKNSNNISFVGLSAGHSVPKYGCEGDGHVIWLDKSQNITIDNCDLWGCGIMGVISLSSGNINITNTTIRDCALYAIECHGIDGDIVFDNCKILRNTYFAQTDDMEWTNCFNIAYLNQGEEGKIIVKNSEISGNYSANLFNKEYEDRYEFIGCTIENNAWNGGATEVALDYQEEENEAQQESQFAEYDESIIYISGITGYEYDRYTVNYHDRVAICTTPAVIEVKKDIKMFTVMPIIEVDGQYVLDEEAFYSTLKESDIVYDASYGWEVIPAKKGKIFEISEPGLYNVFAEVGYEGEWTEIVIEVTDSNQTYDAKYTDSKVMVDGKQVQFEAYNINDNNYFKLRDIAYVLSGTSKQFEVQWDAINERVNMISACSYTPVGGELAAGDGLAKTATNGTSNIAKDYEPVNLKAYMINGNNYFKLRDLGQLFDFDVLWDGVNNCVLIDSTSSYTED